VEKAFEDLYERLKKHSSGLTHSIKKIYPFQEQFLRLLPEEDF